MLRVVPCASAILALSSVAGCAVGPPLGPSVMALPAQNKDFAQFQQEEAVCQQYAAQRAGVAAPQDVANQSAAGSAAVGTILGAAAGAAVGAAAGNPAAGAAIGAASGLLVGGAAGLSAGPYAAGLVQQRYDIGYVQCMYAYGNNVQGATATAAAPPAAAPGYAYPYPPSYAYPVYAYPTYYPYGAYYPYAPYGGIGTASLAFAFSDGGGHHHHH